MQTTSPSKVEGVSSSTNPVSSGELERMLQARGIPGPAPAAVPERPSPARSSGATNPFTSSELGRMLQTRGIPGPAQAAAPERPSPARSSGATNPFTSSEMARMEREGRVDAATGDESHRAPPQDLHPSTRILIEYSRAISVEVVPVGRTDPAAAARQPCIELSADTSNPNSVRKLTVVQSKRDMAVTIKVTQAGGTLTEAGGTPTLLQFTLAFDPSADRIILNNMHTKSVIAEGVSGFVPSGQSIEIQAFLSDILEPGSWALRATTQNEAIFGLSVLPRRNITIARIPEEPVGPALPGTKRPYEPSQLTGGSKRGRLLEDERADQASIVFQPTPGALVAQTPATPQRQHHQDRALVLGFRHPFEDLHKGDTAKILGPDGEDYTLSYDKMISLRANSHVFSAQHSQIPEQLVVVKVVRSPSGPIPPGESRTVVEKLRRMAEVWLREVKIHSRLSQHASVVRLHDHDARFLALYMENVDAPSLLQYPCDTMTEADRIRVLSDTSTALLYIHQQGFVHNDIKPGNILFSRERGAVVIDFGLSSEVGSKALHTGGTPWYVPPEYAAGGGKRGTPGDVFALGVVMLFVVGRLPLPERHFKELWFKILDAYNAGTAAALAMGRWQDVVAETAQTLDATSQLEGLVRRMVAPSPGARVGLERLAEEAAVLPEHQ